MITVHVDEGLCARDGACAACCPGGCIGQDGAGLPVLVTPELCIRCGHCVAVCPKGALTHSDLPAETFSPAPKDRAGFEALSGLMRFRRSIRVFKRDPLPPETLDRLLDLARMAPTGVNTQSVIWIVVSDPDRLRRLAAATAGNLRTAGRYLAYADQWDAGKDVILREAPHLVAACAPTDWPGGPTDCVIALTYLELAAAALGAGACWAGLVGRAVKEDPAVAEMLGVPEGYAFQGALMLGVPKFRYRLVPPRRRPRVIRL